MDTYLHDTYMMLLRKAVEKRLDFAVCTSRDFEVLSDVIKASGAGYLSPTTLKRIWGYVRDNHRKNHSTLNILARYAGFPGGYTEFVASCEASNSSESVFDYSRVLDVFSLAIGTEVTVCWLPNRLIQLKYTGSCIFEVIQSVHSKLTVGSRVRCSRLIEGRRLTLDVLDDDGQPRLLYEAGKLHGITWRISNL